MAAAGTEIQNGLSRQVRQHGHQRRDGRGVEVGELAISFQRSAISVSSESEP
jgi:hypothetical protein